jgi:hypothetical protein
VPDDHRKDIVNRAYEVRRSYEDPKKHFVRVNGWIPAARARLRKNKRHTLRYFTLCGEKAIDVLHLKREKLVLHDGRGYPELVFCEQDKSIYTSIDRLLRYYKRGFNCALEDIASQPQYDEVFPFDVINLDLTRSCFPKREPPTSSTMKTISRMIQLQKGTDFDFFVTFRAERSAESTDAIDILLRNMERNLQSNPDLRKEFLSAAGVEPSALLRQDYIKFILKTFPKLIIRYGHDNNYLVRCEGIYKYQRMPLWKKRYSILKFVFSFDAEPLRNAHQPIDDIDQKKSRLERESALFHESVKESIKIGAINVESSLNREVEQKLENDVLELLKHGV